MPKIVIYNLEGKETGELNLSDSIFALPSNNELLHQAYVALASNRRQVLAHTKDVSEVSGSGKKPWKQKGTGNARVGSKRNPLWRGGGVVFGPLKTRNFKKKINKKMLKKSVCLALSEKIKIDALKVVENFSLSEKKTKFMNKALVSLGLKGSVLVALDKKEKDNMLYCRNLSKVSVLPVEQLNVLDLLNNKYLLLSKTAVEFLEKKYQ